MKKFLILVATIIIVCSCGETSTNPTPEKKTIPLAKTNNQLFIPLEVGNKWVYSAKQEGIIGFNHTWEIISKENVLVENSISPDFPNGNYNAYKVLGITRNQTYNFYFIEKNGLVARYDKVGDIKNGNITVFDVSTGIWRKGKKYPIEFYSNIDTEIGLSEQTAMINLTNESYNNGYKDGYAIKKGVGIIIWWDFDNTIFTNKYELIDVVLN